VILFNVLDVACLLASEPCQCKEEVEREEAQALAAAMERSSISQDNLPHIPGLTRELSEKTITIHVQDEVKNVLMLYSGVFTAYIMLFIVQ